MESNPGGHGQPYIILYINLVIYYTHHILLVEKVLATDYCSLTEEPEAMRGSERNAASC